MTIKHSKALRQCCVHAAVVPVQRLLADMDQIINQRSLGMGRVRVKRRIEPWAIRKVIQ